MTTAELKDIASVAGPLVAVLSIILNIFLFLYPRNKRSKLASNDLVRPSLQALIAKIDRSRLPTVKPDGENWLYGFPSIKELHDVTADANTCVEHASLDVVSYDVKIAVAGIFARTKALYNFGDSFSHFAKGRDYIEQEEYRNWNRRADAENALHDLQLYLPTKREVISKFLSKLN